MSDEVTAPPQEVTAACGAVLERRAQEIAQEVYWQRSRVLWTGSTINAGGRRHEQNRSRIESPLSTETH